MNFSLNPIKFEDVRTQIVNFLTDNSEFAGQFDFTSSNIGVIIDTMAYVTMLMSYQVSNTANNLFLDTTTIRKNALSIAKTMGYRPRRSIAAKVTGTIEYYDATTNLLGCVITIPVYTPFVSDKGYTFYNYDLITLTSDPASGDIHKLVGSTVLYEGTLKKFSYLGNGNPFQSFTIPSAKVEENHFELSVRKNNSTNSQVWNEVTDSFNMLDMDSYFLEEDINNHGHVRVVFGDRYITNYPMVDEVIDVQYLETSAEAANNSKILYPVLLTTPPTTGSFAYNFDNFITVSTTLSSAYGGTPIETIEVIKERAAKTFATVGRAVTQNDYKILLAKDPYIYKANSIGGDALYPTDNTKLGNIYLTAVPFIQNMNANFYNSNSIYLTTDDEFRILNKLDRFRIISTQLNFLKPSYITVNLTPHIEVKASSSQLEVENIKNLVKSTLNTYAESILDFAPTFRDSKVNGVISDITGVISSYFEAKYSFALTKETIYYPTIQNNMIFLPVIIKDRDLYGDVSSYTNFVRTNTEQKQIMGVVAPDVLAYEDRTIYGRIFTKNNDRYIYSEDNTTNNIELCDLLINGRNYFFDLYRIDHKIAANQIPDESVTVPDVAKKNFTFGTNTTQLKVITNTPVSGKDSYTIKLEDPDYGGLVEIGTVKRTDNRSNKYGGLIDKEEAITSTVNGTFYKAMTSFPVTGMSISVSGNDVTDIKLYKDDVIIYNASLSGAKWVKAVNRGTISAKTDTGLFSSITQNSLYKIAAGTSGTFDGRTPAVSGGDEIIFNLNSASVYKWDKVNVSPYTFDASTPIVKEVVPYEIKKIIGLDTSESTNFDGRTNSPINFIDQDLIYYNPIIEQWLPIGDIPSGVRTVGTASVSGSIYDLNIVEGTPVSDGSLPLIYTLPGSAGTRPLEIGDAFIVQNIGDFGTDRVNVNWPNSEDEVAYEGDVILYTGVGNKWNLWQESQPDTFNIDGKTISALPIKMAYGDKFTIAVSGDFNSTAWGAITYSAGNKIIYASKNKWIQYIVSEPVSGIDPSSVVNLPQPELKDTGMGDMFTVVEDGTFLNSYMISPLGDTFIQGDVIIFNGDKYTKLNEYTFEYANDLIEGREYLNNLQFNSVFNYEYDFSTKYYRFWFNDQYHGSKLGTFRYTGQNIYDVGKILFENYINIQHNYQKVAQNWNIKTIFDDNTINKIRFLPKRKLDINGNITAKDETDFVTNFNTFIILNSETAQVIQ